MATSAKIEEITVLNVNSGIVYFDTENQSN